MLDYEHTNKKHTINRACYRKKHVINRIELECGRLYRIAKEARIIKYRGKLMRYHRSKWMTTHQCYYFYGNLICTGQRVGTRFLEKGPVSVVQDNEIPSWNETDLIRCTDTISQVNYTLGKLCIN